MIRMMMMAMASELTTNKMTIKLYVAKYKPKPKLRIAVGICKCKIPSEV